MKRSTCAGFSLIEMVVVVAIIGILTAMAIPLSTNALKSYRLSAAVASVTGAIQTTRFHAITDGCSYAITFSRTPTTYQLANEPLSGNPPACAATFSNLGGPIPWASSSDVTLGDAITLQFGPNGIVTTESGSLPMTLTNGIITEQITVSGVGNVTVTP